MFVDRIRSERGEVGNSQKESNWICSSSSKQSSNSLDLIFNNVDFIIHRYFVWIEKSKSSTRTASTYTPARHGERKRCAHRRSGSLCARALTNRPSGRAGQQCRCVACNTTIDWQSSNSIVDRKEFNSSISLAGISFRGAILDVDVTKESNVHETLMRVNYFSHVHPQLIQYSMHCERLVSCTVLYKFYSALRFLSPLSCCAPRASASRRTSGRRRRRASASTRGSWASAVFRVASPRRSALPVRQFSATSPSHSPARCHALSSWLLTSCFGLALIAETSTLLSNLTSTRSTRCEFWVNFPVYLLVVAPLNSYD